jgi:multidrug efflux pump subunit AcrA (membrane-fusion protein)
MRMVDPGAFVQNASTGKTEPLMTLLRSDRVTLVMWIPEREAPFVAVGQEATIRLDALGGKEITAKVTRLSGWLNPDRARDMRVEVDLDNTKLGLRVGMYGTMRIVLRRFEEATILPASAVFARGGKTLLCQVEDGVVKMHRVRVLYEDGVHVSVAKLVKWRDPQTKLEADQEAPLLGHELIVRSGQGELRDGQAVEVNVMED